MFRDSVRGGLVAATVFVLLLGAAAPAGEPEQDSRVSVKYEFVKDGSGITLFPPQGYLRVYLAEPPYGNDSLMFFAYSPITAYDSSVPVCGIGFTDTELAALAAPTDCVEMPGSREHRVFARFRQLGGGAQQVAEWTTYFRLKNQTVKLTTFFTYRNEADKTWAEALHKEWRDTLQRQNQEDSLPEIPLWNPAHPAQMTLSIRNGDGRVLIPLPGNTRLIPPGDLWQVGVGSPVAIVQGPSGEQFDHLIRVFFPEGNYRGRNPAAKVKALKDAIAADFKRRDISVVKDMSGREDFTFIIPGDRPDAGAGVLPAADAAGYLGYTYFFVGEQAVEIEIASSQADTTALETALLSWRNTVTAANK